MEVKFKGYKCKDNSLDFTIKEKEVNGICGKNYENLINIIKLKNSYKGKIIINDIELNKDNINTFKNKINVVKEEIEDSIYIQTVYDLLKYEIERRKLSIKNPEKKIYDSLKIVNLDKELLERNIYTLSSSEKKFSQLAISLLSNPDMIILIEPFKFLDMKNENRIMILLNKIREQYKKTIVIVTNNTNIIFKYTTHTIIFKVDKILVEGDTKDIFQRVDFLSRNKINIPEIVEFTYLAKKKKNVSIDYHSDIRDIIKDIYKHV